jgi:DNA (cytosine-5)-methyltransferase 1
MTRGDDTGRLNVAFNSFFAGIGGFDVALDGEGFSPAAQCEIDVFCQSVLATRWPDVKLFDDITAIDASDLPTASIWCGGFPCQDVSVARGAKGREGLAGKNSGLFYSFLELIKAKLPPTLLLENVVGLLSSHNGQDFRVVIEELTALGYSVAWRVMNSRYFGSPQSRPRVFVCASLQSTDLPIKVLYQQVAGQRPTGARRGFLEADRCGVSGAIVAKVAYCLAATSGRHTGTDWSRTYVSYDDAVRRLTPFECEGLQGFPVGWTNVAKLRGVYSLDEDSFRYKALGNAVSVPVAKWIAKRLKSELLQTAKRRGKHIAAKAISSAPDFMHPSVRHQKLSGLHLSEECSGERLKWQSGGFAFGDECWDISAP